MVQDQQSEIATLKALLGKKIPKVKTDRALQAEVRRNYQLLKTSGKDVYDLDLRFDCLCNRKVTERVIHDVHGTLGNSYNDEQITSSCRTYFTNMRADRQRKLNGNFDTHRKRSSRTTRLTRKLERRRAILNADIPPPLSESDMVLAKEMLSMENEYMSSDESETEDSEDAYGPTRKVRRLAWQSSKMTDIKDTLDRHGIKIANKRQRAKMTVIKRDASCGVSARPVPSKILNWAVDVFYPTS